MEPKASGGLAANLVSTIRSFLPMGAAKPALPPGAGKKPVKVECLITLSTTPCRPATAAIIGAPHSPECFACCEICTNIVRWSVLPSVCVEAACQLASGTERIPNALR